MAKFFLSHAGEDKKIASTLSAALADHAVTPGLSRLVTSENFAGGENYSTLAVEAIQDSDAVILLYSRSWAASKHCYADYVAAKMAGKFLVALTIEEPGDEFTLPPGTPGFMLDHSGLLNLVDVLSVFERADPRRYEWRQGQMPYPGLRAFKPTEAGVFFGRDTDIQNARARISAQLLNPGSHLSILVGPTGSGVSSLMLAGILPELQRNEAGILILPTIRPRLRPVDAFAVSIATALETPDQWRHWADGLRRAVSEDPARFLEQCVQTLRAHRRRPDGNMLLPIDQLEELFEISEPAQAEAFEALIAVISASELPIFVLATLGSEKLKPFMTTALGACNWNAINVAPIPLERYPELIREPAKRAGVSVQESLIDAIIDDAARSSTDRLSLVAYSLRLMWRLEAPFGQLSTPLYKSLASDELNLSGLQTSIAVGADMALRDAEAGFEQRQALDRALIELTVEWDRNASPVRRPAGLEEFPRNILEVLNLLEDAGILARARVGHQHLVELTSSALFRCWPRLESLVKVKLDGSEIVASHCRELARFQPPEQASIASRPPPWRKFASFLGEGLTAACLLGAIAFGDLQRQRNTPELLAPSAQEAIGGWLAGVARAQRHEATARRFDWKVFAAPRQYSSTGQSVTMSLRSAAPLLPEPESAAVAREPVAAQLPKLLRLVENRQDSLDTATSMLLTLEVLYHPRSSLLSGERRAGLKQRLYAELIQRSSARTFKSRDKTVYSAAISPDGRFVASASADGIARVWDTYGKTEPEVLEGHGDEVYSVAFNHDGSQLMTASRDMAVRIWNTDPFGQSIVLNGHKGAVHSAVFDANGRRAVSASADQSAIVWDVRSGKRLQTLRGHRGPIWSAKFSRDGARIVTTSKDRTARIWQSDTGRHLVTLGGHDSDVVSAAFSPDGGIVATGSRDGSVRLWDSHTGKETDVLLEHKQAVISTMFSDDGRFLITASFDHTAKIRELATGQLLLELTSENGEMRSAQLSRDQRNLLTASSDGILSLRPVSLGPSRLVETVLEVANGCLTPAQRRALDLSVDKPWWCMAMTRDWRDLARVE